MLVREAMTPPRLLLAEDTRLKEAAAAFVRTGVQAAPVIGPSGKLCGIVTEIDLLRDRLEADPRASIAPRPAPESPLPRRISDVMTRQVITTTEVGDVAELAQRMYHARIRCVPVVREGTVIGMVCRRELLRAYARPDTRIRDEVLTALSVRGPYTRGWDVRVADGVAHLSGRNGHTPAEESLVASIARMVPGVSRVVVESG
ncbi:CBS domain-containing protein [Nocardiopsis mwathae]|uniref:CBS domain-containing protein n=1 Tax=Nocardiopsis mwathae TaxID=1472723 RepID=A0A7W9YI12_9ACTN|nr:CBS domain-containing protein [Nocardiopsis mwathae]MBB6171566.1 CBS domain-containing protein [Nocardiopsis mwathae]